MVDQVHLTQILLGHPVEKILGWIVLVDDKTVALSVEYVDLLLVGIIEALVGEVLDAAGNFELDDFAFAVHKLSVEDEVVVDLSVVVEETHEDKIVSHEAADDEGIRESIDCHGPVVNVKLLVNFEF